MTALIGLAVCALWLWIYRLARRDNGWAPLPADASEVRTFTEADAEVLRVIDGVRVTDDTDYTGLFEYDDEADDASGQHG